MKQYYVRLFYIFCLFFFIQPSTSKAQDAILDSLEIALETSPHDTLKLEILLELSTKTIRKDAEKSIVYILEGIRLAKEYKQYHHLIGLCIYYSYYLTSTNTIDSALTVIEEAYSYLPHVSDKKKHLGVLTEHASLLQMKGDLSEATQKYLNALKIAKENQLTEIVASCYIGLSGLFYSQKMYAKAIQYNQKCAGICDDLPSSRTPYCFGLVYSNLATFFLKQKQIDSTIYYGLKAIEFKKQVNNLHGLSLSYSVVANAYLKKKDTLTAIPFYEKALEIAKKVKDIKVLSQTLTLIGKIHVARKNVLELQKIVAELDAIAPKFKNPSLLINYYQVKRNFFELKKDYKGALELLKNQFNMVDSLRKGKNATLIASLETKYRTNQHKLEKELTQKELLLSNERAIQSKRNLMGVVIFTLLVLLLLLYISSRLRIIRQQKIALNVAYEQLERQKQDEVALLSLKALQAQMNPHFIFNALNSIQDLVLMKDIKNSTIYIGKFSALIRKILLSSKEQFISLNNELEILSLYLDLEKLRFGEQLNVTFNCLVSLEQQTEIQIPAMFIQPYIENAIKHGLFHKKGLKKLLVEFRIEGDFLVCVIEDNGIGQEKANEMKEKTLHLHTGFSTEAIQHRIQFLNQTMQKEIRIQTDDLGPEPSTGTRITLYFSI